MSFDCSRFSFQPWNDFFGVVMQQGRVQLDSDWNEWVAELSRRLQAGTMDTLGRAVVPRTTPEGFHILATGGQLSIGPGRIYVDGILAENHGGTPLQWDPALAELEGTTAEASVIPVYGISRASGLYLRDSLGFQSPLFDPENSATWSTISDFPTPGGDSSSRLCSCAIA
jgi:hypothetical protein